MAFVKKDANQEKKEITANGVTIYHDKNEKIHSFCLCLYLRAGSMYETKENNGISHFLEHIVFRNIHHQMGETLYQTLDQCGLEFNATTYKEFIQFIITGAPKHFKKAAEILTMVFAPITLSEEAISVERKRIKAEIREEDEERGLSFFTKKKVWGKTSLAYAITGKKKCLDRIKKEALNAYQREVMSVPNLFFYLTGNYEEEHLRELAMLISRYTLQTETEKKENMAPVPANFFHRNGEVWMKKGKKTSVCFCFDVDTTLCSLEERNLLFDILFEGDFCKIHQGLSEQKGYIYSYDPGFEQYGNIAHMTLSYEVLPKNLYASVHQVITILKSMKKGIKTELSYVKPYYVDNAPFVLDRAEDYNWVRAYEGHILETPYAALEERIGAYKAVSARRMTKICREIFCLKNIFLTLEGDKKKWEAERLSAMLKQIDEAE